MFPICTVIDSPCCILFETALPSLVSVCLVRFQLIAVFILVVNFLVAVFARVQTFVELGDHRGEHLEADHIFCYGDVQFCNIKGGEADGSEVGLPDDAIERSGGEFFPHHFGDGNHGCCGRHVMCSVLLELRERS